MSPVDGRQTTVGEALVTAAAALGRAGLDDPDLEARILLGRVLGLPHLEVALSRKLALDGDDREHFAKLVRGRCERRPLQRLLGDTEFYGRCFEIGEDVFIPRPETESLAEVVLRFLPRGQDVRVAEIGCGSGVVAVTIAVERPRARVWCSDLSPAAVSLTARNARLHGVEDRVVARVGRTMAPLSSAAPFDLVLSNPPYVSSADIPHLQPEVRLHDPRAALDGGTDGLDVVRRILREVPALIAAGAPLLLELGVGQAVTARRLAGEAGWVDTEVFPDLAGRERVLCARAPEGGC